MRKVLFSILVIFGLAFLFADNALASDLTVTCNTSGPCSVAPAGPLFNETNWFPGQGVTRTVTVVNNDPTQVCNLTLNTANVTQTPSNFAGILSSYINDGSTTFFNNWLQNLFTGGTISLGTVPASTSKIYNWNVTLDGSAGNEFQNSQAQFDFNLGFSCDVTATPSGGTGGGGGSVAGASTVCTASVPTSAPLLTTSPNGANSVRLNWTPVTPATHYMIRYGITPGNYIYGASNVGNVNSFIVNLLSGGTTYYFQVAGVNDCMPGPWSNEASATPGGVVLPVGPAAGFTPGTLGVSTEASPSPSPASEPSQVLGTQDQTCQDKYYPWWIPLVIQALASAVYLGWRWRDKRWWAIIGLFGVISQVIHWILKCNCGTGRLCTWYWLFNLVIIALSVLYYEYQKRSHKKKVDSA